MHGYIKCPTGKTNFCSNFRATFAIIWCLKTLHSFNKLWLYLKLENVEQSRMAKLHEILNFLNKSYGQTTPNFKLFAKNGVLETNIWQNFDAILENGLFHDKLLI